MSGLVERHPFVARLAWTALCLMVALVPVVLLWDAFNSWGIGWAFLFGSVIGTTAGVICLAGWSYLEGSR